MKTLAQFALLGLALFCCAPLHAAEYNIPSRETAVPTAEDFALAKLIQPKAVGCSCPATGICSCAVCDCPEGAKLKMNALIVGRHRSSGAGASCANGQCGVGGCEAGACSVAGYPDVIVQNGVKLYRLGSPAAAAVGLASPAPVQQQFAYPAPQMPFSAFQGGGFVGSFFGGGGNCFGGSCGRGR